MGLVLLTVGQPISAKFLYLGESGLILDQHPVIVNIGYQRIEAGLVCLPGGLKQLFEHYLAPWRQPQKSSLVQRHPEEDSHILGCLKYFMASR